MSAIRRRDTRPELTVRRGLHARGLRFRVDRAGLPGRPDVVLPRWRAAVFVHGCFWHRHPVCRLAATPTTNAVFWMEKFRRNVVRDQRVVTDLREMGWRVAVVWECALRAAGQQATLDGLETWIRSGAANWSSDEVTPPVARHGR